MYPTTFQVSVYPACFFLNESFCFTFSIGFAHKRMYISLFTKNCALTTTTWRGVRSVTTLSVQTFNRDVIYYQRRFYHHHNDKYINLAGNAATKDMGQQKKTRMWFQTKTSMEKVHRLDISSNSSTILCNALDRSINKRSVLATTQFRKSKDAKA